jgi:hypothetical protein
MKKIIFTIGFMVVYITIAHAQKNVMNLSTLKIFDVAAVTIFDTAASNLFKVLSDPGYGEWARKDPYDEISSLFVFSMFKGERISNYYDKNSFIGFSCRFKENDLRGEVLTRIKKRYSDCVITDVIIFMDINGNTQLCKHKEQQKIYSVEDFIGGQAKCTQKNTG